MIDLEDRVGTALHTAAESVSHPPLDPTRPRTLARRRRRNRRTGRAMLALLALVGLGAAIQLRAGNSSTVQTADEDGLDEQGVPVDTGPELDWKQVDGVADLQLRDVVWSGERFLALGGEDRGTLYSSPDGQEWQSVPDAMPDDFVLGVITSGDGRVVAWGWDWAEPTGNMPTEAPTVLVSDDHGVSWQELGSPAEPQTDNDPSDYLNIGSFVPSIAVDGDTIMVVQASHPSPSVEEVLADRGLLQPGDDVVTMQTEWRTDTGEASATYCLNPPDQQCGDDVETIEFVTKLPDGQGPPEPKTTVWASTDGGPFEPVARFENEASRLVSAQGRFFIASWDRGDQLLATDDDGLTWTPVTLDRPADDPVPGSGEPESGAGSVNLGADGSDLIVTTNVGGRNESRRSSDGGRTWTTTPLAATIENIAVGPGGQLLAGRVYDEDQGAVGAFLDWLAELGGADKSPPGMIGWSADGVNWGWQSRADAFGSEGWTEVAVSETTAIAVIFPDAGEDGRVEWSQALLFVAEIPS